MHILIINFNLNGIDRVQYESVCATNTYGGVYLFKDKQAMLDYQQSELYDSVGSNPAFANVTAVDFEMLNAPSRVTGVA